MTTNRWTSPLVPTLSPRLLRILLAGVGHLEGLSNPELQEAVTFLLSLPVDHTAEENG